MNPEIGTKDFFWREMTDFKAFDAIDTNWRSLPSFSLLCAKCGETGMMTIKVRPGRIEILLECHSCHNEESTSIPT